MKAFKILDIPSAGGYGTVCVARYVDEDRVVALKVLKTDYLREAGIVARTRDEARMLFRLRHPNIVSVEQMIDLGGRPVLIMEWVEGASLKALYEHHNGLPASVVARCAHHTAQALVAAWNHPSGQDDRPMRIIHRDIKPSNILMSVNGEVKVVDFGGARGDFDDREHSTISTILGSHGYIAPERFEPGPDTPAVDVYSLGITMLELVFGHMVFFSRNPDKHDDSVQDAVSALSAPELGDDEARLRALITEMCRHTPSMRPTASEVAEALADFSEVDLTDWAEGAVKPMVDGRQPRPPEKHPEWKNLSFLEQPWDEAPVTEDSKIIPVSHIAAETDGDRRLRRFLKHPDWTDNVRDLLWLLASNPDWTERPFLDVIDRHPPWWKFWRRSDHAARVATALGMLKHRRTPEVLARAQALLSHGNARVVQAAGDLLDAETQAPRRRR